MLTMIIFLLVIIKLGFVQIFASDALFIFNFDLGCPIVQEQKKESKNSHDAEELKYPSVRYVIIAVRNYCFPH